MDLNFQKKKKFIYFPDFANKFLIINHQDNMLNFSNYKIQYKYIFNRSHLADSRIISSIMMIESIYPKRSELKQHTINVKLKKTKKLQISVSTTLNFDEYLPLQSLYTKKPSDINIILNTFIKQNKSFTFPGFVTTLQFPSWQKMANLHYLKIKQKKSFLIHKAAFID